MDNRFKQIALLLLFGFVFASCDEFELRGFILSYESADQRFDQSMEWNNAHPYKEITVPVDDYLLYVMGDSHVGGTKNLDIFMNEAMRENAAAVVMIGDLTTGHAADYTTFQQHLPSQDSIVSFPLVGNHELYFDGWNHFYSLFGSSTYLFTVKTPQSTDVFICLDTGSGTLGSNQIEWLKDILETERPNYRRCVLFSHVNLFRIRHTVTANLPVEELYVLMELSVKHQIDMVVTGHNHRKNDVVFGNTTHITMDALEDDFEHAGFLKLFIKQGKIEYEFVNL